MIQLLKAIFPPAHKHPQKFPHEWAQPFDPTLSELQPSEHGCSEAKPMALILDYEQVGRKRVVIQ